MLWNAESEPVCAWFVIYWLRSHAAISAINTIPGTVRLSTAFLTRNNTHNTIDRPIPPPLPPTSWHLTGYWPPLSHLSLNNRHIESPSNSTRALWAGHISAFVIILIFASLSHSIIWLLHNLGRKIDPNGVGRKAQARNNQAAWEPQCQGSHDWSLFVASQIKDFYYRADRHRGKKYTWTTMI